MYARAEKAMDSWTDRGLITPEGKAFLIATLDPFHDSQIPELKGYPDIESSPSIVRMIKQSITISKDPSMPAGNWDCQIVAWPWMKRMPFVQATARVNNRISAQQAIQDLGGLQVLQVPSSSGNFDLNLGAVVSTGGLELSDEILQGSNRLIGAGYEVHNTTADIYKQGSVCNYMMHNVPKDSSIFTKDAGNIPPTPSPIYSCFSGTSFRSLPRTTAEAMLIPGSREWAAADGCYSVCRFAGVENPPFTVDYNLPVLFEEDDIPSVKIALNTVSFPNTSAILFPAGAMNPTASYSQVPAWKSFPIHTSGSIFTGLSDQTTLRLNFNVILESFPGPRDVKDLSIATPSPAFDPRTLEIYSHTLCSAPVSVPVAENPLGEWFTDVIGKVGNFLATSVNPIAATIGTGMGYLSSSMKPFMTTPSGVQAPRPKIKAQPLKAIGGPAKATKTYQSSVWASMSDDQRRQAQSNYTIKLVGPPQKSLKKKIPAKRG